VTTTCGRHFKPAPETYLGLARLIEVERAEVMMVATHFSDRLLGARPGAAA
jgi:FMN phosphatase YigB (HAD superfamily)